MALVLKDRVKEVTTSTGTGTITLAGAATGFQSFSAVGNSNTTYYTIADQAGANWEVGIGTYTASGTTLSRDTVLSSSNGGALVDFPAGAKDVFVTYPSEFSQTAQVGDIVLASEAPTGPGTWLETGKYYSKAAYPDLATKLGNIADFGSFATVPQAQLPQPFAAAQSTTIPYICATDGTTSVVVGASGAIRKTTDGINWQGVPSTTTNIFNGVRYVNSRFLAIGATATIVYSTNGTDWVNTSVTNATVAFTDVAYGAGMYVVVAGNTQQNIYTSSDLITWTNRTIVNGSGGFQRIVYANGLFVAVGAAIGRIYTSPDGITWTNRSVGSVQLFDVIYANSLFVAVGGSGACYTSPDGITWTSQSAGSGDYRQVIYANSLFVAVGFSGTIFTSPDGITWTSRTSNTAQALLSITWNGSEFIAVSATSGLYVTSPDGVTWTAVTDVSLSPFYAVSVVSGKTIAFGPNSSVILAGATRQEVLQSGTWAYTVAAQSAPNPRTIAYNGTDLYVAAGSNGTILTSSDGQAWTGRFTGLITNFDKVAYLNGNWIAMGGTGSGTNLLTSPDGITWTARTAGTAIFNYAAFGAGVYVVVGASGAVFSSPDLVTWTSQSAGAQTFNDVIFANGVFVAIGNSNSVYSSSDGITWTLRTATGDFTRIIYANSLFVAVGAAVISTSPDGITWTARTSNTSRALRDIAWNGSLFLTGGGGGGTPSQQFVTSPDGITWTLVFNLATSTALPLSISWTGSRFIVTNNTDGSVMTTVNGTTWEKYGSAYSGGIVYSGYLGGKMIAIRAGGIQTSTTGLNWVNADQVQYVPTALNRTYKLGNKYYALSTTAGFYQSNDGVTWSAARTAPLHSFVGMAYNGFFWLALTGAATNMPASVYKSTDGLTWTKSADFGVVGLTLSGAPAFIDIEYANGNFIIGCPISTGQNIVYTIYTSTDGVTWTGRLTPLLAAPSGAIASDGTTTVIVTFNGTMKSTDGGVTWSIFLPLIGSGGASYSSGVWQFGGSATSIDLTTTYPTGVGGSGFLYASNGLLINAVPSETFYKVANSYSRSSIYKAPGFNQATVTATVKPGILRGTTALVAQARSESFVPNLLNESALYSYDTATTFFVPPSSAGGSQTAYIYAGA